MEQSWFAMAVGAGLIFGFLIAWISLRSDRANIYARGRSDAEKDKSSLEERILAKDTRIQELQQTLQQGRESIEGLREENAQLRATHVEYDSRVMEIRQQAEEKIALVNESQQRLVETLRGTLDEKTQEQEVRIQGLLGDLAQARQEYESLRVVMAATPAPGETIKPELLAEREQQLSTVLAEALEMKKQIEQFEAEKAALAATPAAELLAARERQLTSVLGEALQLRERVQALEAEQANVVPADALREQEAQLAAAVAERDAAHERVQALEAEQSQWQQEKINTVTRDVLAEREAQLASAAAELQTVREQAETLAAGKSAALAEADGVRERLQSLETEKAVFQSRIEALEAEKTSKQPSVADRVAFELLADRENQLKELRQQLETVQTDRQTLKQEASAELGRLEAEVRSLTDGAAHGSREAESLRGEIDRLTAEVRRLGEEATHEHSEAETLRAESERLTVEVRRLTEEAAHGHQEAETLRAENARLEAAVVEAQATVASVLQRKIHRMPFSPVRARQVVEMSGLFSHSDFAELGGEHLSEVATIRLPGSKRILVHSLPDYHAYEEALAAANETEYVAKVVELAANVRNFLASIGSTGKELAVAYLPGDVLLGVTLEQDSNLLEFAAQRGLVVATPNSLVGLLGTANASWRQHKISGELEEARAQNQNLFGQLATLAGSVESLRSTLGSALSAFQAPAEVEEPASAVAPDLEQEPELVAAAAGREG